MKCPKCRYLSFEPELRCKHCGYDFSLAEPNLSVPAFDELEQQDPDPPLVDLQLRPPVARHGAASVALAERVDVPVARPPAVPLAARRAPIPPADLPLFVKTRIQPPAEAVGDEDERAERTDEVELRVPAAPRPLVVRRRAPDSGRQAGPVAVAAAPALVVNRADRDLLDYLRRVETEAAPAAFPSAPDRADGRVAAATRLKAAGIDMLLLSALNATVVLLTLRQCDLGVSQLTGVPVVPLTAFLVSLSVAYLLMFNVVGGQTIGKMVCGLRVVGDQVGPRAAVAPTPRQMSYRALLTVPSVLLLGLGFLPFLAGEDRTVHDRLTHTRVVRV